MKSITTRMAWALTIASLIGVILFITDVFRNGTLDYWYLPYNLALGVIPLFLAVGVVRLLQNHPWQNWRVVALTLLWLLFLPNSFYIVTDFIHLFDVPRVDIVQDVVMLMQFSIVGLFVGFYSVRLLQKAYLPVLKEKIWYGVGGVLFLCSTAIYLGRELRWNSWDLVVNPLHLLGDIVMIFSHAGHFLSAVSMTLSFFVMLASTYWLLWVWSEKAS